jgi:hypothetical protein
MMIMNFGFLRAGGRIKGLLLRSMALPGILSIISVGSSSSILPKMVFRMISTMITKEKLTYFKSHKA